MTVVSRTNVAGETVAQALAKLPKNKQMIFEVITEPVIADRLYGGIMERIAEEVAKMENEKLDEEG